MDLNGWCPKEPLLLLAKGRILRGREGKNQLVHVCRTNSLFFSFSFFVSFFSSYLSFLFFFLVFYFVIPLRWLLLSFLPFFPCYSSFFFPLLLRTTRAFFYSACHGRILLFQPLITFVQSGCTCRPPLYRLCATPHHHIKMTILFVSLSWHLFLLWCGFSLPIPHGMHLVTPAQLCPFGWCVIPTGHSPQKSHGRNLKIGFPFSPPPSHAFLPLTQDLTAFCIGWVQAGEVQALRMPSFHMCPKFACRSLVCRGLEAYLHSLLSIF